MTVWDEVRGPDDLREVIVEAWLVRAPDRLVRDYLSRRNSVSP